MTNEQAEWPTTEWPPDEEDEKETLLDRILRPIFRLIFVVVLIVVWLPGIPFFIYRTWLDYKDARKYKHGDFREFVEGLGFSIIWPIPVWFSVMGG